MIISKQNIPLQDTMTMWMNNSRCIGCLRKLSKKLTPCKYNIVEEKKKKKKKAPVAKSHNIKTCTKKGEKKHQIISAMIQYTTIAI